LLDQAVREYRSALDCAERGQRLAKFRRAELLFARIAGGASDPNDNTLAGGEEVAAADSIYNADLYVNLGNAALGAERLGPAILAYRRALLLDPDHHRARQNLAHARTLLPDWVPRPDEGGWFDTFFAWRKRLSRGELQMLAAVAFFVAAGLLAGSIRWRQPGLRNLSMIPACGWLLLVGLILFGETDGSGGSAVVIIPEVIARSADSTGSPARLPQPLPGGTELEVIEVRDNWTHVRLFDSRDAWLPTSAVRPVICTSSRHKLSRSAKSGKRPFSAARQKLLKTLIATSSSSATCRFAPRN
jgi:hypothetical protein